MTNNFIHLHRNLIVPPSHLIYQKNDKHFKELVDSLNKNGLENAISVCSIPNSELKEIIDGDLRFLGWCVALDHKEILCEIRQIEYSASLLIDKRIELNRHRQKTLVDKLEEGLEYYNSLPDDEQGERNDLKGEKKGARMDRAHKIAGVSTTYLYAYQKIVNYDTNHPEAGLLEMFRKNQIGLIEASKKAGKNYQDLNDVKKLNGVGAELLDNESLINQTSKKIDELEDFINGSEEKKREKYEPYVINDKPNFATANNRHITANSYASDRFKVMNKDSATITRADIPEGWLQEDTRIVVVASDPFKDMKIYAEEAENAGAIGNEETPEEHNRKRIAVYKALGDEILRPADSVFVEYDAGQREDSDNLLTEDFNIAMVRQNGYHKRGIIAWHRTNNAMQGNVETNLYNSWTPITWFVKDIEAFKKSNYFNNVPFHKKGKEIKFGVYGGRQNKEEKSYTKNKVYFKKPYKRYTNFIDQNDFLDSINSAGAGTHSNYILKTYGVKHPASWLPVVALYPILYLTRPNDIIISPFAGTGSELVTACLFGRRAIGCDISEPYYKIIIQEMEKATREFNPESAIKIERMFQEKFAA